MTKLKIKVTKDILERSKMCLTNVGYNCAVALAVRDIFPRAWVEDDCIMPVSVEQTKIPLPESATDFISKFDRYDAEERVNMPELEFEISIPDEVIEKINIEELKPLLQNHPTLQLIEN